MIKEIQFTKPKKTNGNTYSCQLYYINNSRKKIVKAAFDNVKLIDKKISHNEDVILVLKEKDMKSFMSDLNTHIISSVKIHHNSWFSSNMSSELIDDYFLSTITYTKDHGDVIKIHIPNSKVDIDSLVIGNRYSLEISFDRLRFFKQKFLLECSLLSSNKNDEKTHILISDEESDSENEDVPEPTFDEILDIRDQYLSSIGKHISIMTEKITILTSLKDELIKSRDIKDIVKVCAAIENQDSAR